MVLGSYEVYLRCEADLEEVFGLHWYWLESIRNFHLYLTIIPFFPLHFIVVPREEPEDEDLPAKNAFGKDGWR